MSPRDDSDGTDEACGDEGGDTSVASLPTVIETEDGRVRLRRYETGDGSAVRRLDERALRAVSGFEYVDAPRPDLADVRGTYLDGDGTFLIAEAVEPGDGSEVETGECGDSSGVETGEAWVGARGESIVGCGGLRSWNDRTMELRRMRVRPDRQGEGIAREMLDRLESIARVRGYEAMTLGTMHALRRARAFYEAAGYEETYREAFVWGEMVYFRTEL